MIELVIFLIEKGYTFTEALELLGVRDENLRR